MRKYWRRSRRVGRCVLGAGLAAIGLFPLAAQAFVGSAHASPGAMIVVNTTQVGVTDPGHCSLQEAIYSAEFGNNIAIGATAPDAFYTTGCTAGTGNGDTIVLQNTEYDFSHLWDGDAYNPFGPTATPIIFTTITIRGNGATLKATAANFRMFAVGEASINDTVDNKTVSGTGNLSLQNVYVTGFSTHGGNGACGGGGGLGAGGAVYLGKVGSGVPVLNVDNSTFTSNTVKGGRGSVFLSCPRTSIGIGSGGGGGGLFGSAVPNLGGSNDYGGGGGGGGARGDGGAGGAVQGGGGGGGTVFAGNARSNGGSGGFRCGGNGGDPDSDGHNAACPGGGGGGGGGNETIVSAHDGGNGAYGGGGGGGGEGDVDGGGSGKSGGFGGGGASAGRCGIAGCPDGGNGGFGGGGGASDNNQGSGGFYAADATDSSLCGCVSGGGGAGLGGAIFNDSGNVVVHNSTFAGNVSNGGGAGAGNPGFAGGGAIFSRDGSTTVIDTTMSGNNAYAGFGDGLFVAGDNPFQFAALTLDDTIISNQHNEDCTVHGTVAATGAGNLIETTSFSSDLCPGIVSTSYPQLGPLQLNAPGNTPTMAIQSSSPAAGAADAATSLATDQRGVTRPGPTYSIGAYEVPACTHTLTGSQGPMLLSGGTWCVNNATFSGSVAVATGTKAFFTTSTINGSLAAKGATGFSVCGTTVTGTLTSGYATGFVVIGDPGDDSCPANQIGVDAAFNGNTAGVEIGHNSIGRNLTLQNNRGTGPNADDTAIEIEANTITGNLGCVGNSSVTNDSQPNTVHGARYNQCAASGF